MHYKLGVDGLDLMLVALTARLFFASALWPALRPPARAGILRAANSGSPRPP